MEISLSSMTNLYQRAQRVRSPTIYSKLCSILSTRQHYPLVPWVEVCWVSFFQEIIASIVISLITIPSLFQSNESAAAIRFVYVFVQHWKTSDKNVNKWRILSICQFLACTEDIIVLLAIEPICLAWFTLFPKQSPPTLVKGFIRIKRPAYWILILANTVLESGLTHMIWISIQVPVTGWRGPL